MDRSKYFARPCVKVFPRSSHRAGRASLVYCVELIFGACDELAKIGSMTSGSTIRKHRESTPQGSFAMDARHQQFKCFKVPRPSPEPCFSFSRLTFSASQAASFPA
jgi:hypothetical protein